MVTERRRRRRHVIKSLVAAADVDGNPVPVTMTDISETGIGLSFAGKVLPGETLKFTVLLPGTKQVIKVDIRVMWTRTNHTGRSGNY
jgi:hypothetical protein